MKLHEIKENTRIPAGEYLLHIPSNAVVVCGNHRTEESMIQVMAAGEVFEDSVQNFNRISLTRKERKRNFVSKGCGSCKKFPT